MFYYYFLLGDQKGFVTLQSFISADGIKHSVSSVLTASSGNDKTKILYTP